MQDIDDHDPMDVDMDTELPKGLDLPPGLGPPGKLPTAFTTGRVVESLLSSAAKRKDPPVTGGIDKFVTKKVKESHPATSSTSAVPKTGLNTNGKHFYQIESIRTSC